MLLLVDGSSYLYRAFHALPDLRNAAGEPTGAIFGVLNMLRRLETDYKANASPHEYRAVVFDAKGKTFRDELYPQYKAHRPPMPTDLAAQIAPLHECIRALGWPLLMIDGVEADDVIGALADAAAAADIDTLISTGDKDMAQLVSANVRLINTMSNELLDVAGVAAKFGVPPERIVDYLALVGDAVDNVPGVDKVGPKTAVKWLNQYGTLQGVIDHAAEIGGAVGESLRRHLEFLPLGKKLVTIVRDVPLPLKFDQLVMAPPQRTALQGWFARLEFKQWLKQLEGQAAAPQPQAAAARPALAAPPTALTAPDRSRYEIILDAAALDKWLALLAKAPLVALDSETTGLEPMTARLVGMSFCIEAGLAAYLPLAHDYAGAPAQLPLAATLNRLKPWLEDASRHKVGQNLKFDEHIFANHGISLRGIVDDTLLQSYVLEADKKHELGDLAARHCALATISFDEITGKGASRIGINQVEVTRAGAYAAEDADVTWRVHQTLSPRLAAEPKLARIYRDIELPVARVLTRMERHGVLIDSERLRQHSAELGKKLMQLEEEAHQLAGMPFNLASPKQLGDILFTQQKLPILKKTPGGAPSTDESVLEQLALDYPLPKKILEHRALAKLKNTYTDKLPLMVNATTGRVHTSFAQAVAVTGRLASNDPNLQNIPVKTAEGRRIRAAFIAATGCRLVSADYSQVELRIMAHLSGDARLLDAFARNEDIHRATAAEVFGLSLTEVSAEQRRAAKAINFGLIYGMSAFGLSKQINVERAAAQNYMERYFARFSGVARYMEETRALAKRQGYVETVLGRRLWLPEIHAAQTARRQGAERAAINAPMQGTAADLIKLAMLAVQDWLNAQRLNTRLLLQVHDELILEAPEAEIAALSAALPGLMGGVAQLTVPLAVEVGIGMNWDEAH